MVDSVNSTTALASALKALQDARADQTQSEARLASGLKVAAPRDNPSAYSVAETLKGEATALRAVTDSLSRAEAISDITIGAAEQVSSILNEIKTITTSALANDLTDAQRASYQAEFTQQLNALAAVVNNANFDDTNLLNGSLPSGASFVADATATETITLQSRDFNLGGTIVTLNANFSLASPEQAQLTHDALLQSQENVSGQLVALGTENKHLRAQIDFVAKFATALAGGVGTLVDADLANESALIQALQVKQSLSAEVLNIANAAPQTLLALFR